MGLQSGVGVLDRVHLGGPTGDGLVGLIDGGGVLPVVGGTFRDGVYALLVGAVDPADQQFLAPLPLRGDIDLDGVLSVVSELEIGHSVVHRGVHAHRDIAGVIAMVIPLHHLQGAVEQGVVNGRGGLAHASAHLFHRLSSRIDCGGLIAHGGRAAACAAVEGEDLPGHDDRSVAGLGGQLHIELPVGRSGEHCAPFTQHIPEKLTLQAFLGILGLGQGHGDGEGLPLTGLLIGGLQGLHIEIHTHHMVGDRKGLRVHDGVLRLRSQFLIDGVKVGLLGRGLHHGKLLPAGDQPFRSLALPLGNDLLKALLYGGDKLTFVHGSAAAPLGHSKLIPLNGIRGLGDISNLFLHLADQVGQRLGFIGAPGRLCLPGHPRQMRQVASAPEEEIPTALLPRGPGVVSSIQAHIGQAQGIILVLIGQGELNVFSILLQSLFHRSLGLGEGHTGHIHTQHGHIGINGIHAPHPGAQAQIGAQEQACRRPRDDADLFLFSPISGLLFHALTIHFSHTPRISERTTNLVPSFLLQAAFSWYSRNFVL